MNTQPKTPFKRLVAALTLSNASTWIAMMPALILLLTLKMTAIAPHNVAASLGTVTSIGGLLAMIMNPIGGALGDRTRLKFGKRRTWILFGNLLGALSFLGIGFATQVWQVTLLWCGAQTFFNFAFAANSALIAEQVDEDRRSTISGPIGAIPNVASLIGIVLLTSMGNASDGSKWSTLALIAIAGAIITVMLIKDGPAVGIAKKQKTSLSIWNVLPNPKKHPTFAWAWISRFAVLFCVAAGLMNSVFLTQRFHFSSAELSSKTMLITIVSTITVLLSSVIGGIISDRFKRQKPFVILSGIIMAIAFIIQGFAPNFNVVLIAQAIYGLGSGVYFAVDMALLTRVLPNKEDTAKDLGILNIANALPQSIVPAMMAPLLALGGFGTFFTVVAVIAILGSLAVLKVPEMNANEPAANQKKAV